MHRRVTPKKTGTEEDEEGNSSGEEKSEAGNGSSPGQSTSTRNIRTRSCTIPLIRVKTLGRLDEEKIRRLENRLEFVERHCRLLRRRVRALEMERAEDIKRTVLQVLNNQKFTISTSFSDYIIGVKKATPGPPLTQDEISSSSEEEVVRQPKIKIPLKRKLPSATPDKKPKRRQIVKPDPLKHSGNSRTTSSRASSAVPKPQAEEIEEEYAESEPGIIPESFENNDSELITEGDVSIILEDYGDGDEDVETAEEYVTLVDQKPIKFRPKRRRGRHQPPNPRRIADVLNRRRREMICLANKKYTCSECDNKAFKSKWEMERHSLIHNRDQCFKCPLCPKTYTQRPSVTRHFQRWHKGEVLEDHEDKKEEVELLE